MTESVDMSRSRFLFICLAALAGYAAWLAARFSPEPGGADASGYLHSAQLLTEGRLVTALHIKPELRDQWSQDFQPLGFEATRRTTRLVPIYPVGLPLHLAGACLLFGWHWGPYVVGVGGALATLVMCYLLARELGLSRPVGMAIAGSLAPCAVFVYSSIQPLSDTLATFWCCTAVWTALRARRGSMVAAAACGVAFSIAVLVRPSNALLLPALALLWGDWKKIGLTALAGIPVAVALGFYQNALYGSPWRSGYGELSLLFSPDYFWPTMGHFAVWVGRLLPMGVFGLVASVFLVRRGVQRREVTALLLWVGAFVFFHAFYVWSRLDWSFLRFLAPAFPAMLLLAGLGMEEMIAQVNPARQPGTTAVVVVVVIAVAVAANALNRTPNARKHDRMYVEAKEWARRELPPDALVVSMLFSGMIYFQTGHPVLRWDIVAATEGPKYLATMHRAGQPVYAVLDQSELADPRMKKIPGKWEKLADFESASAWKITPDENR
ncbi:MAG: hypothetical protein HYV95_15170 [Opitutae bacterium]|nr:hypothetical protein [Opitutae bacterium]